MSKSAKRAAAHAVGIDLGTTYSCLSYLTPQGEPVTLPNAEGELSTPSVVLFDGDNVIVGTEALRHAVSQPERVIQHAKRFMGDRQKFWVVDGTVYRPVDVSALILQHLIDAAEERLGRIRHAVVTVPAQFSDIQRQETAEAGRRAGLERVDIINEPVAAALCYVLSEGMWFAEIANDQTVMVFDLGGGTFDLSLVKYNKQEVKVVASGGDLQLGGIDWNRILEQFACDEFIKETPLDPRLDKESMQALAIEVEQTKRSLSVRPKAPLTVQHAGRRKTYSVDQEHFELLTSPLVAKCEQITRQLLKDHKLGWAHVDSVLVTGGATRMPMVRKMLQRISGTTLNTTLSPDQSISHGAAYYAGMLLSGEKFAKTFLGKEATARLAKFKQQSVNARALGILVRDKESGLRVPHYLIPANTPLPCAYRQNFGTVVPNQKRVHLHIVESGASLDQPFVRLGACVVEELPANLPEATPIEVTIRYDEQARVHVSAVETKSGREAKATIVREENLKHLQGAQARAAEVDLPPERHAPPSPQPISTTRPATKPAAAAPAGVALGGSTFRPAAGVGKPGAKAQAAKPQTAKPPAAGVPAKAPGLGARPKPVPRPSKVVPLDEAERPIPLCNYCGEALDARGRCTACGRIIVPAPAKPKGGVKPQKGKPAAQKSKLAKAPGDDEIIDLQAYTERTEKMAVPKQVQRPAGKKPTAPPKQGSKSDEVRQGEQEFWNLKE
jgi:molecular chaperone DnaK